MTKSDAAGERQAGRKNNIGSESQVGTENSNIRKAASDTNHSQANHSKGKSETFDEALRKKIDSGQADKKAAEKAPPKDSGRQSDKNQAEISEKAVVQADWMIRQIEPPKTVDKVSKNGIAFDKAPETTKTRKPETSPTIILNKNLHIKAQEAIQGIASNVNSEIIGNPDKVSIPQKNLQYDVVKAEARSDNAAILAKKTVLPAKADSLPKLPNESIDSKISEKTALSREPKQDTTTIHTQPFEKSDQSGSNSFSVKEIKIPDQAASRSGADGVVSSEAIAATSKPAIKETLDNESMLKEASHGAVDSLNQEGTKPQVSVVKDFIQNAPAQSSVYKINVQAEQVKNISHVESPHKPVSGDVTLPQIGTEVSPSSDSRFSSVITEITDFQAEPAGMDIKSNPGLGMARQIEESISSFYRPGAKQIVVRLDPPELGQLTIKFIEHRDGDVTAILHADKSQTKDQIQQALPAIIQNLQNSGIQIKKFDVQLNYQQSNASDQHNQGQNHPFEHSTQDISSVSDNNTERSPDSSEPSSGVAESQIQTSSDSINVLI